jgi:hypothetical protein
MVEKPRRAQKAMDARTGQLVRRGLRHLPERLRHRLRKRRWRHRIHRRRPHHLRHIGTELGTGMSTSQALVVAISSVALPTR